MSGVEVVQDDDVLVIAEDDAASIVVILDSETEIIQTLEQGPPGPPGIQGPQGATGHDGNTILYGPVDPTPTNGIDGNFYINTTSHFMFGPKAANLWPAGISLIGPQGPQGVKGDDGNTVLYGTADPVAGTGVDGNFYINTTTHFMFGPKAGGAWPAGTSLVGPQGLQGIQGAPGLTGGVTITVSPTPPTGVADNTMWWNSTSGLLYVRYNDGNSTQWVIASPQPDISTYLPLAGGSMTGPLTLNADPAVALGAATKQYSDTKVAKAGDTMTGNLTISASGPTISLNKPDATHAGIAGNKGLQRWFVSLGDNTAESGSNAGSNFGIYNYNDAGAYLGAPLTINRANGQVSIASPVQLPRGLGDVTGSNSIQFQVGGPGGVNWRYNETGSFRLLWDNINGPWAASGSGYQKFGSGFIIQWGTGGGGPDAWVSFPVTFPNFVLFLAATSNPGPGQLANQALVVMPRGDYTTSQCVWQCRNVSDGGSVGQHTAPYWWLAIGY